MLGNELALQATGWRRWLYAAVGTIDIDEWIWYWHYRRFFFPHLRLLKSGRILDAGCNQGLWSFYLARRFPHLDILGIDINPQALAFCQKVKQAQSIENVHFQALPFTEIDFAEQFDVVLSFFSLHYSYRQDVDILKRFARALKPGGLLALSVPVANSLRQRIDEQSAAPAGQVKKYGIAIEMKEFLEHYHPGELTEKLHAAGLEPLGMYRIVGSLGYFAKRLYASANRTFLKLAVWPIASSLGWLDSRMPPENGWYWLVIARLQAPGEDAE